MPELSINTTQNVKISFTTATIGQRILAYALDMLIKIAYGIMIYFIFFTILHLDQLISTLDQWSIIGIFTLLALPVLFYSLLLESLFEGQTLGKKMVHIKVVKIEGYQASFGDYVMRWLFRIIDINIGSGIIGLLVMIFSKKTQRLGDIVAETAVISLKNTISIHQTILEEIDNHYIPTYPQVIKLSDNDLRIIKDTWITAKKNHDTTLLLKLSKKIEAVTGIKNQSKNEIEFIEIILKDYNFYTQNM